jgi:hypothetical protein
MSHADHEWAKDVFAAHLADGLDAEERARLEAHIASCAECIAALDEWRRFDRSMTALFEPVRPTAGMEERVVQLLRSEPVPKPRPMAPKVILAAAAVLLLGLVGYVILQVGTTDLGTTVESAELLSGVPRSGWSEAFQRSTPAAEAPRRGRAEMDLPPLPAPPPMLLGAGSPANNPQAQKQLAEARRLAEAEEAREALSVMKGESRGIPTRDMAAKKGPGAGYRGGGKETAALREIEKSLVFDALTPRPDLKNEATGRYYSYSNRAPSDQKTATAPAFFKPGEQLAEAKLREKEALDDVLHEGQRKVDPARPPADPQEKASEIPKQSPRTSSESQQEPPKLQRKIIRSGEMEFEIESFDSSVATLTKIVIEEQGFVATVNSEKLPNGKVRGTVVVRVPPDHLDLLLLKLRALGDLKSQRIGSEDVTKQYTDLESRLRAARTMEERLLNIIKEGKGQIKDLLQAEKELGEWRIKVETMMGEINYYNNLIAQSTLTITLYEKEIRAPSGLIETEKVEIGIEVEDVEKAHREALAAVAEAKGRVTKSELKQLAAGQYSAIVNFEVAPEQAGPLRDRFRQLGVVARLDINRVQETKGGTGRPQEIKLQRNDTQVYLSLYNVANMEPRETVHLNLACVDAEKSYKAILARIEKAAGRVLSSNLSRQKSDQTSGLILFHVKSEEAEAVLFDVRSQGEVMKLEVTENPDSANVTRSKRGFNIKVFALGTVQPRETSRIVLASRDVAAGYKTVLQAVKAAEGRILSAQLDENDRKNVTADLSFDFRREHETAIQAALAKAGDVYTRNSTSALDSENVVDSKILLHLRFFNSANIPPRETVKLGLEVGDVDQAAHAIESDFKGRVVDARHTREASGQKESVFTIDVPRKEMVSAVDRIRTLGTVRDQTATINAGVPDNDLAVARLEIRVSNEILVAHDSGPWANIRRGLAFSLQAGSWSLMLIMIGVCFVLPLAAVIWLTAKVYRKLRPKVDPATPGA